MLRGKKLLSILLTGVLCFSLAIPARADDISDAKAKQKELESQKKAAEDQKSNLNATLNAVIEDMTKTEEKLNAKQIELIEAQDELDLARINESEQYASMKLRIKFMYENGSNEFIEILCESKSIADFLNKAEYIQQISSYDRKMLVEFQKVVKEVEEQEAKLKEEEAELVALQDSLIEKQAEVEQLIADNNAELSSLESQIGENSTKLKELIAAAEEARRQQGSGGGGNVGQPGDGQIIGNGQLSWPATSRYVTSPFGWRVAPVEGATSYHDAIDIGAGWGTPVYAADGGTVTTALTGTNGGRGHYIMINHGNGITTRYQHMQDLYVSPGQTVSRGQNIGTVGNTGASSGPHLDFAVYVNGITVDPMRFF